MITSSKSYTTFSKLQIVKYSSGPSYFATALPHFIIVLHLLGRALYTYAFYCYLRDLLRIRSKMPLFFWWFCSNLNRVVVCLHIEYQLKELASFAEHLLQREMQMRSTLRSAHFLLYEMPTFTLQATKDCSNLRQMAAAWLHRSMTSIMPSHGRRLRKLNLTSLHLPKQRRTACR